MDSIKLTKMFVRLFAVCLVAWAAASTPWVFTNYITGANVNKTFLYFVMSVFLPVIFPILTAAVLWLFAGTISGQLNSKDDQFSIEGFSEEKAFKFGLFFLGAYVSFYASVDLVSHLMYMYIQLSTGDHHIEAVTTYPDLVATIFELALGIFIMFRRQGINRIVQRVRGRSNSL
jgi:hypothetical protein